MSKSSQLKNMKRGGVVNDSTVVAVVHLNPLTSMGGPKLVKDPNADDNHFILTSDRLYAYVPLAEKQPCRWIAFEHGDVDMLRDGVAGFMAAAKKFGMPPNNQQLGTVQHIVDGENLHFCDIARGGTNKDNHDNEGDFARGTKYAMRWIHLVDTKSAGNLEGAMHAMLTQGEEKPTEFDGDGDVTTRLWVGGTVVDPEDLTIEEA